MAIYICYNKNDQSKEVIMKTDALSLENAIEYFSTIKQLSAKQFNKLFNVEKKK
jgi:hypothetical protein